jgi:hypothetical protein
MQKYVYVCWDGVYDEMARAPFHGSQQRGSIVSLPAGVAGQRRRRTLPTGDPAAQSSLVKYSRPPISSTAADHLAASSIQSTQNGVARTDSATTRDSVALGSGGNATVLRFGFRAPTTGGKLQPALSPASELQPTDTAVASSSAAADAPAPRRLSSAAVPVDDSAHRVAAAGHTASANPGRSAEPRAPEAPRRQRVPSPLEPAALNSAPSGGISLMPVHLPRYDEGTAPARRSISPKTLSAQPSARGLSPQPMPFSGTSSGRVSPHRELGEFLTQVPSSSQDRAGPEKKVPVLAGKGEGVSERPSAAAAGEQSLGTDAAPPIEPLARTMPLGEEDDDPQPTPLVADNTTGSHHTNRLHLTRSHHSSRDPRDSNDDDDDGFSNVNSLQRAAAAAAAADDRFVEQSATGAASAANMGVQTPASQDGSDPPAQHSSAKDSSLKGQWQPPKSREYYVALNTAKRVTAPAQPSAVAPEEPEMSNSSEFVSQAPHRRGSPKGPVRASQTTKPYGAGSSGSLPPAPGPNSSHVKTTEHPRAAAISMESQRSDVNSGSKNIRHAIPKPDPRIVDTPSAALKRPQLLTQCQDDFGGAAVSRDAVAQPPNVAQEVARGASTRSLSPSRQNPGTPRHLHETDSSMRHKATYVETEDSARRSWYCSNPAHHKHDGILSPKEVALAAIEASRLDEGHEAGQGPLSTSLANPYRGTNTAGCCDDLPGPEEFTFRPFLAPGSVKRDPVAISKRMQLLAAPSVEVTAAVPTEQPPARWVLLHEMAKVLKEQKDVAALDAEMQRRIEEDNIIAEGIIRRQNASRKRRQREAAAAAAGAGGQQAGFSRQNDAERLSSSPERSPEVLDENSGRNNNPSSRGAPPLPFEAATPLAVGNAVSLDTGSSPSPVDPEKGQQKERNITAATAEPIVTIRERLVKDDSSSYSSDDVTVLGVEEVA